MISDQLTVRQAFSELPVRLYSALRTIRIYPLSNPQVTKTTDKVIAILDELLEREGPGITLASSGQRILVNGTPLPEKDQQRPQIQGLIELLGVLQIHSLTFQSGFTASDCIRFLELLSAAGCDIQPDQPIKKLLQEAGLNSVSVDEKRYVAVHEGEQVVTENQIGPGGGGLQRDDAPAESILGRNSGGTGGLSAATLHMLIERIGHATSPDERSRLTADSSAALAGLAPDRLLGLLTDLPENSAADVLLTGIVERLDTSQLEALLLSLPETALSDDMEPNAIGAEKKDIFTRLLQTDRTGEIEQTAAVINSARTLIELSENPTPHPLKEQLQQPQISTAVLVAALRELAGRKDGDSTADAFSNLMTRYEQDLAPTVRDQVATQSGSRLAALREQELGRILVQRYPGIFGEQLYNQVIARMSDEQFERIAQRLNLLVRNKQTSPSALDTRQLLDGYRRLMNTIRGEKLRTALTMHQELQDREQQLSQDQMRENIKQLLAGDQTVLVDKQVVQALPASIQRLLQHEKNDAADKLLIQMVTGLQKEEPFVRRGSAEALGRTAATLVQAREWQRLDRLLPALEQALPFMENLQAGGQALQAVEQLTRHHLTHKAYNRAVNALNLLFDLTIHSPDGHCALHDLTLACLVRLAEPALLGELLENIQAGNKESDNCWYLLSRMGAGAANFLMEKLGTSESREERELLLRLIGDIGKPARDALLLLLQQDAPWYVTRNIIRLLKNVGDADCFAAIVPFLRHEDLRVQQEVIQTLGVIGGTARKNFFLQELEHASDDLKPLIIRQLGKIHNESIVLPLIDLLESSAGPPLQEKEQLQIEICVALVRLGSKKALTSLKKVVQTKTIPGINDYSPKVLAAAESAVQAISTGSKILSDTGQQPEFRPHTPLTRKNDPLADKEASIFRKASRGKTEEAKKELYELIISCAEQKDFANAERLRERIYEIDPIALSEIIRSGEIIEREKTGAVSRDRLAIWSRLLKRLNNVEFSAVYHELQERTYAPEETIVRQGDTNDELYFINQGSIKISYNKDGRDIFVSTINSGQIIGENFFDASFWTVTLTALTPINISVLQWDGFRRWQEEYPGLEAKLQSFYKQCDTTGQLLEKKGLDRRKYERTRLSRKIQLQLTDHNNKPIGRGFRGELTDISEGGLAFLIRISKKENTRLLLGRNMQITVPVGGDPGHLQLHGLAIGIQSYEPLENDFSVHIKFPDLLDQKTLFQILG